MTPEEATKIIQDRLDLLNYMITGPIIQTDDWILDEDEMVEEYLNLQERAHDIRV